MSGPLAEIAGQGRKGAIATVGAALLEKLVDKGIEFVKDRQTWADLFLQYENKYFESRCRLGENGKPENGIQVANQHSYPMVLGGPGAGKSTYLRRIGLAAVRGEAQVFEHDCIPVMLELKQFKESVVDLQTAVAKEFANVGFDFSQPFVEWY